MRFFGELQNMIKLFYLSNLSKESGSLRLVIILIINIFFSIIDNNCYTTFFFFFFSVSVGIRRKIDFIFYSRKFAMCRSLHRDYAVNWFRPLSRIDFMSLLIICYRIMNIDGKLTHKVCPFDRDCH